MYALECEISGHDTSTQYQARLWKCDSQRRETSPFSSIFVFSCCMLLVRSLPIRRLRIPSIFVIYEQKMSLYSSPLNSHTPAFSIAKFAASIFSPKIEVWFYDLSKTSSGWIHLVLVVSQSSDQTGQKIANRPRGIHRFNLGQTKVHVDSDSFYCTDIWLEEQLSNLCQTFSFLRQPKSDWLNRYFATNSSFYLHKM